MEYASIVKINNIKEYLDELNRIKRNYLIVMVVRDTPGSKMGDDELNKIHELGFTMFSNKLWMMYIGIIYQGNIYVNLCGREKKDALFLQLKLGNHLNLELSSQAWRNGDSCCVKINSVDYAVNLRGINIVTYDDVNSILLDTIGYDSTGEKNIFQRKHTFLTGEKYKRRCNLLEILPKKIKVRLIYWGGNGGYFWNVYKSLIEEFMQGDRYDVKVISYYNDEALIKILSESRIKYEMLKEWDMNSDKADILIISPIFTLLGYSDDFLKRLRACSKILVAIPSGLIFTQRFSVERLKIFVSRLKNVEIDYIILDALMFQMCMKNHIQDSCIVEIGNPKFDTIYTQSKTNLRIPESWKKINNKLIVLWLVDHDWQEGTNVSFDIYAKAIFSYFQNEKNVALIFRPHPVFIRDMLHIYKMWTQSDVDELHRYINNSKNIIWDELPDYSLSYQLADAMMMEIGTGTIISALSMQKPIALLYRNDCKVKEFHPEVTDSYYHCFNENDAIDFIEKMKQNKDPLKKKRKIAFEKYISHFDGKNGQRIKNFLFEAYKEKNI